jgi:hypothetical protein
MDLLTIHAPQPLIAGQPATFQLVYRPDVTLQPGGWFKVAFDYRGKDYRTQHVQCADPAAPNYVAATATGDARVFATAYRLAHYDQASGREDSESYAWRDRFGPAFSLNVEVVQVTLTDGTLGPGDELRLTFGTAESGFLLSCKSYARYPFWGLVDPLGDGDWRTVGPATTPIQPGPVALLLMVAPSLTVVDEPFSVRAAVFDEHFNPVAMKAPEVRTADPQVRPAFTAGAVPMSFPRPGLQRLHRPGGPWPVESNPSLCRDRPPAQRIFWGEIHGHTVYSDGGLRGPEEYYAFGRDSALLDFCAVSDHDFGIALHDPAARWGELVEAANHCNEDGRFVTFLGWEISHAGKVTGRTFGHKNVYFRGDAAPFYNSSPYGAERVRLDYRDLEELWELLRGEEVLAIAHHPLMAATPGGMGTNWNNFHPPRERLVEVFSLWGCSEHLGTPQSVGTATAGNSVQAALARGYRLGFTAGSDGHDGRPASRREDYFPVERSGLTAVYAPELTRAALWDALWARHTYATTGVRMILDFRLQTDSLRYGGQTDSLRYTLGDAQMGDVVPVPPDSPLQERRSLWLRAIGTDDLDRVEIVRNNRVVETFRPDGAELAGRWEDPTPLREITLDANGQRFVFYYLRVTQSDGHRGWTSPVWVECAEGVVGN